jgi:hypothetical protein
MLAQGEALGWQPVKARSPVGAALRLPNELMDQFNQFDNMTIEFIELFGGNPVLAMHARPGDLNRVLRQVV